MVCQYLKGCKHSRNYKSQQILTPVSQHYTGNHRWKICQCVYLPYMTSGNDDQEIAAERPYHRTQHRQFPAEIESTHKDIEA